MIHREDNSYPFGACCKSFGESTFGVQRSRGALLCRDSIFVGQWSSGLLTETYHCYLSFYWWLLLHTYKGCAYIKYFGGIEGHCQGKKGTWRQWFARKMLFLALGVTLVFAVSSWDGLVSYCPCQLGKVIFLHTIVY